MHPLQTFICLCAVWSALGLSARFAHAQGQEVGSETLKLTWDAQWRRVIDRHGRPDPEGGLQQRLNARQYPEYAFDLAVTDYPVRGNRAWSVRDNGARLRVQSINEFTFFHEAEIKVAAPVGDGVKVGMRLDRRADRTTQSGLLRLDVEVSELADTPLYLRTGLYARWEKEDLDVDLAVGLRDDRWGRLSLRALLVDPFNDVAYALAESREAPLPRTVDHQQLPLIVMLEGVSAQYSGAYVEIYGALIPTFETAYVYTDDGILDHQRLDHGWAAGALVEYHLPTWPVAIGASALALETSTRWRGYAELSEGESRNGRIDEGWRQGRGWALSDLGRGRHLEVGFTWTDVTGPLAEWAGSRLSNAPRPGEIPPIPPNLPGERAQAGETRWLAHSRLFWPFGEVWGGELGFMAGRRLISGRVGARQQLANQRITTRFTLQLGDRIWGSFGLGWDVDGDGNLYDGGGLNLSIDL
ncbi:MAG: hypothetical protein ACE366_24015 [Bradymonadia bacterium]